MKKLNFILLGLAAMTFFSCKNDVDLYSDKGESTIVYMMLDTDADTNFVKITKSFIGNAEVMAQDYDACNYQDGEIDVKLVMEKNGVEFPMLPVQKWIPYDPNSMFYSGCYQTYYYTTAELYSGEKYKLVITRNDGVVVTSEAKTIDNFTFLQPTSDQQINYTSSSIYQVKWTKSPFAQPFETNAAMFQVVSYFRYEELQPGATEWVEKEIKWTYGSGVSDDIYDKKYYNYHMEYIPDELLGILENDKYLKENSPAGVQRKFKKLRIDVTGIGEEFYNYLIINNSSSAIQDTPEYTNVENGIGLMSARVTHSQKVIVNAIARQRIVELFPQYGFIYDQNDPVD